MFRNKTSGIAAAATLGLAAMLGSTSAYALKIFDTAPGSRTALNNATTADSVTFASETLLTTAVTEKDDVKYYNVGGTGSLVLSVPATVGADQDDAYLVAVTLDGMVFRAPLNANSLTVTAGTGTPAFSVATGGAEGDKAVVFRLTSGSGGLDATSSNINVTAQYAISEGGGSATVTLTNQSLAGLNVPGVVATKSFGPKKVIKAGSALKETATTTDLIASVESGFKKFTGSVTSGSVGSLVVGFNGHRVATVGNGQSVVDDLKDILVSGQSGTTANSSVSFMGDFSFTSKVFVHGDSDCGAPSETDQTVSAGPDTDLASAEDNIQVKEGTGDDAVVTGTTKAVNLDATPADTTDALPGFTGFLCIEVQGDDTDDKAAPRIPDTDAYTAVASYKALPNAASGPMGMERTLGEINRDGTTIHLPYLSTNAKYNQRIRIVNRSSADTRYEMEFHGDDDVAGSDAEGTLDANSITVLSLRTDNVVTPGNGHNTSATIIVEASSSKVDVATVQINRETGNSDTVVYSAD